MCNSTYSHISHVATNFMPPYDRMPYMFLYIVCLVIYIYYRMDGFGQIRTFVRAHRVSILYHWHHMRDAPFGLLAHAKDGGLCFVCKFRTKYIHFAPRRN